MTNRALIALGVAFIVLAAIAYGITRDAGPTSGDARSYDLLLSAYTNANTSAITISKKGVKPVMLTKVDGTWKVAGKSAATDKVNAFFKALAKLDDGVLVSENPDNHKKFGATTDMGYRLTLTRDGKATTFIVGNMADTPSSFYVKQDKAKEVWQVAADLMTQLAQDAKTWQTAPPKEDGKAPAGAPPGMPTGAPPGAPAHP